MPKTLEYKLHLARAVCTCGSTENFINVGTTHGVYVFDAEHGSEEGMPLMTGADCEKGINIIHFGNCSALGDRWFGGNEKKPDPSDLFGRIADGIASALSTAVTAFRKCEPVICTQWENVKEDYLINGKPVLTEDSFLTCKCGGTIRFVRSSTSGEASPEDIVNSVNAIVKTAAASAAAAIPADNPPFDKADVSEKDSDTHKILSDLEKRWIDAGKLPETERGESRSRYEQIAEDAIRLEKEGTPYMYGQDIVADTLHKNAKTATEYQSRLLSASLLSTGGSGFFEGSSAYLALMAQTDWNYKENEIFQVGGEKTGRKYSTFNGLDMDEDGENRRNWTPWIYFEGKMIAADDVGNMNMAYVGKQMDLPPIVYNNIVTRNRFPEIYLPDERDIAAIEWGMELADSGW